MTASDRRSAGAIAARLARAAREVVRAVQSADAGAGEELERLLRAELDVAAVAAALREVRRGLALEAVAGAGGGARHAARDGAGRFQKVHDPGAP